MTRFLIFCFRNLLMISIPPTVILTAGGQRSLLEKERYAVVYRPHDALKPIQALDQVSTNTQNHY